MDSFKSKSNLKAGRETYSIFRLKSLEKAKAADISRLPFSVRILLENLLRHEDGQNVKRGDIESLAGWSPSEKPEKEIAFTPARVILQDFTGVPAVVDLAAMRDSLVRLGKDPKKISPLQPVDLVIDHSVQVDFFGSLDAFRKNVGKEFERNAERYRFLKWGQQAFRDFRVVPPGTGIVHQVNLEYLASGVMTQAAGGEIFAFPDTLVGTDSHTTMINGLGVLGWGVGGIEAEAAMLGQPISMLIPKVVGFRLTGRLREGATATDAALTVTEMLRKKGVVGKFVEFFGDGLDGLSLADRATIANMAPEYGATIGFFPADKETLNYLRLTGRSEEAVSLVEAYLKEQGLFRERGSKEPLYSDVLELHLKEVAACLAGPRRPQDRISLKEAKGSFAELLKKTAGPSAAVSEKTVTVQAAHEKFDLKDGSVVIAAITSCANTSNPNVMMAAGLAAKKALERGLQVKPWVKTSLAPGSKVVMGYLRESGLLPYLERLRFHLTGYGCTTCIGNSGPLPEPVEKAVSGNNLTVVSVLSGNRNFEGRIHPLVKANYLASPPLVVAYAIAGDIHVNLLEEPLGRDSGGRPVFLRDIWPTDEELREAMGYVESKLFRQEYRSVFDGDESWKAMKVGSGDTFSWDPKSTYIKKPLFFENLALEPSPAEDIRGARILVSVGDSVTTDHISPAGPISKDSPAGKYLIEKGVRPEDFNSYGSRRGNHEVMMRGTFANIRLKNLLLPGTEGGLTRYFPGGEDLSIYNAAMRYREDGTPLIILAGKEYGTGSSRDWAAKGPALLGVKAVIAGSFERIHRSNLIGMGILPLQYEGGSRETLGLKGDEIYAIEGIARDLRSRKKLMVTAARGSDEKKFSVLCRIDTPVELAYYQHGGILPYVLRQLCSDRPNEKF